MTIPQGPLESLRLGQWFKLICGASYQDVSKIRNLSLVYTLAGADCIDLAADIAVVHAAWQGIAVAREVSGLSSLQRPWLMVSLNDGRDPHFRKAQFTVQRCPADCLRPCERVCPADAIPPILPGVTGAEPTIPVNGSGVITERCYGCGRCLPICPHGLIEESALVRAADQLVPSLLPHIEAIEIHTQIGRQREFKSLWQQLIPYIPRLQLVAISCPDGVPHGNAIVEYLHELYRIMEPKPNQLLWQTDGRPMSGDLGRGTTHAAIRLAQKVLNARLPGYVQLAGGTNGYTVAKLRSLNLLKTPHWSIHKNQPKTPSISGIAYGSYARQLVVMGDGNLENEPQQLWHQVNLARKLVGQIKPDILKTSNASQPLGSQSNSGHITTTAVPP